MRKIILIISAFLITLPGYAKSICGNDQVSVVTGGNGMAATTTILKRPYSARDAQIWGGSYCINVSSSSIEVTAEAILKPQYNPDGTVNSAGWTKRFHCVMTESSVSAFWGFTFQEYQDMANNFTSDMFIGYYDQDLDGACEGGFSFCSIGQGNCGGG